MLRSVQRLDVSAIFTIYIMLLFQTNFFFVFSLVQVFRCALFISIQRKVFILILPHIPRERESILIDQTNKFAPNTFSVAFMMIRDTQKAYIFDSIFSVYPSAITSASNLGQTRYLINRKVFHVF